MSAAETSQNAPGLLILYGNLRLLFGYVFVANACNDHA
jgi:hypothetical protein